MKLVSLGTLLCIFSLSANASVVMNNTRVIYSGDKKSVNVQLVNKSAEAHLVQSWIDNGNPDEKPENLRLALAVVPSVVRIGANDGQILTVVKNDLAASLPKDRESLFWLNFIDIPPNPKDKSGSYLQFAIRNRVKVFYRPTNLSINQNKLQDHLKLTRVNNGTCIKNSSPYYVTVAGLSKVKNGSKKDNLLQESVLAKPFSCASVGKSAGFSTQGKFYLTYIDDFGTLRTVDISR
ncbi:molecular chaperone [Pantoea sp. Bo_2]|uniref:fimbrial biogenesis chaperone n=1 Tax=unclassified Pantoea TaxID=2630326 RepID=UPI00123210BA|nr:MULTISPECIES: molecular chaperone [unclassified Pantoea]KAA5949901.1 molecular chaperone [Pantoea sp. VH_3]KAA5953928.1 molecular chaperone [Pantoea sp. VH_25]KAA5960993.1 molecular chaperone [Pantoea sp. VH_24]KAA5964468.1 molecular chaperone [Pantoea sp. VH_16]KAA5968595.1 molecular chaperone [Pantoea sp. VH_18]